VPGRKHLGINTVSRRTELESIEGIVSVLCNKTGQIEQNGTIHDGRAFVGRAPRQKETPFVDSPSGRTDRMIHLGRSEKCVRDSRQSHQKVICVFALDND
jgi:hypothetical protein